MLEYDCFVYYLDSRVISLPAQKGTFVQCRCQGLRGIGQSVLQTVDLQFCSVLLLVLSFHFLVFSSVGK